MMTTEKSIHAHCHHKKLLHTIIGDVMAQDFSILKCSYIYMSSLQVADEYRL